jgi:Protein of unknown function (DUF3237)
MQRRDLLRGLAGALAVGCVRPHTGEVSHRPRFEPLMTLRLRLAAPTLGDMRAIAGGNFEGTRLRGIVTGGTYRTFDRPDGLVDVDARATLVTDAGTPLDVTLRGMRSGVDFRTTARFEAPFIDLEILERMLVIGTATQRDAVQIHQLSLVL